MYGPRKRPPIRSLFLSPSLSLCVMGTWLQRIYSLLPCGSSKYLLSPQPPTRSVSNNFSFSIWLIYVYIYISICFVFALFDSSFSIMNAQRADSQKRLADEQNQGENLILLLHWTVVLVFGKLFSCLHLVCFWFFFSLVLVSILKCAIKSVQLKYPVINKKKLRYDLKTLNTISLESFVNCRLVIFPNWHVR